jgi:hypothetical protein
MELSFEFLLRNFGDKIQYIGQLEQAIAAAVYWTFDAELEDTCPAHFIDNQGALGALVRGDSSDGPMAALAHECALQHLLLRCTPWFEYVPSAANISDIPSRGRLAAVVRMLTEAFGLPVRVRDITLPPSLS